MEPQRIGETVLGIPADPYHPTTAPIWAYYVKGHGGAMPMVDISHLLEEPQTGQCPARYSVVVTDKIYRDKTDETDKLLVEFGENLAIINVTDRGGAGISSVAEYPYISKEKTIGDFKPSYEEIEEAKKEIKLGNISRVHKAFITGATTVVNI